MNNNNNKRIPTIEDRNFKIETTYNEYHYQEGVTEKLDLLEGDFDESIIHQVVLWKVNRYPTLAEGTLRELNKIKRDDTVINDDLTKTIMELLLKSKGIQLAMASTILRFKNPMIYAILDQRVYRFIYGETLKEALKELNSSDEQTELYLKYLRKLREICEECNLDFDKADRILYLEDKKVNKDIKLL